MKLLYFLCTIYAFVCAGEAKSKIVDYIWIYDVVNGSPAVINASAYQLSLVDGTAAASFEYVKLNLTIIPPFQPNKAITLGILDHRTIEDYRNILKNLGRTTEDASSFKSLLEILKISPEFSEIDFFTNTEPKDQILFREISNLILEKFIPVDITLVSTNGSEILPSDQLQYVNKVAGCVSSILALFEPIKLKLSKCEGSDVSIDGKQLIIPIVDSEPIQQTWARQSRACEEFTRKIEELQTRYEKCKNSSPNKGPDRFSGFVFDLVNITDSQLTDTAELMRKYFEEAKKVAQITDEFLYNSVHTFDLGNTLSLLSSSDYENVKTINTSNTSSTTDFRNLIQSYKSTPKATLKTIRKALQISPPNSGIVWFVNSEPENRYELLPEIVEIIQDKHIKLIIKPIGVKWTRDDENSFVPPVYQAIRQVSWLDSSY